MSKANADRVDTTNVVATQHIDPTGKVQPAGDSALNPIYVSGGASGGGGDVAAVESDIDGNGAQTTNSLIYGRESTGVTHPVSVDSNGNLVTSGGASSNVIYGDETPGANFPTANCVAGAAIQFDITSFADLATLKQVSVTQLTPGNYDYTVEIWEKDSSGYVPGTYSGHYLKIFSRDIDQREYNENINGGLLYRDRDASSELHVRLVNNAGGTSSTFNVSVVAEEE
ncbi:MAG: hypothetical protein ACT6FG_00125 [Methanosarcinaceae archaeon]